MLATKLQSKYVSCVINSPGFGICIGLIMQKNRKTGGSNQSDDKCNFNKTLPRSHQRQSQHGNLNKNTQVNGVFTHKYPEMSGHSRNHGKDNCFYHHNYLEIVDRYSFRWESKTDTNETKLEISE